MMGLGDTGFEYLKLRFYFEILTSLDYFTGKSEAADDIDKSMIQDTLIVVGKANRKPESGTNAEADRAKSGSLADKREEKAKRKEEEEKGMINKLIDQNRNVEGGEEKERELTMMKFLMQNEKRIVSKNSILQVPGKSFVKIYAL
jgi:hypothetical protein